MAVIKVNGRAEVVSDCFDGIEVAQDIMGDSWYSFMRQELLEADEAYDDLDEEIQEYKHSEESLIEEYQGYLHEVEDLLETALAKVSEMRSSTKLREIEKILIEARKICFENT